MNLKIKIGDTRVAIVLPLDQAAIAVALLQHGRLMIQDGYSADGQWIPHNESLQINTGDGTEFAPVDPRIVAAQKDAAEKQGWWLSASEKARKLEKERDELKASLETLKGQVTCTAAPAADEPL